MTTATFFGVLIQLVYEFVFTLIRMVLDIKIVNELQSLGMMGELITGGVYGREKCG